MVSNMWMGKASQALKVQAVVGKTVLLQSTSIDKPWKSFFSVLGFQHASLSPWIVAPLQGCLNLTAGLFCVWGFSLRFLPLCEIPTDWFQRKASVTFSAELLQSKITAILCLWNSFSLYYLRLLWVRIWDLPYPSCSWGFHFFCCKISWNKINLKQTQPDCRGIYTSELGAAVSCNAWWFSIPFLIVEVLNWENAGMLAGLDRERSLKHFYFTKGS